VIRERKITSAVFPVLAGAAVLLSLSLSGHAQLFGGDEVARKQLADQSKRITELKQQNDALLERLARIEESVKILSGSQPALELAQQLELVRQELKQLRGQSEVLGNEIQMAGKRQRDMYVDLDTRMKRIEQPPPSGTAPAGSPPAAAAAGAPPEQVAGVPQPAGAEGRVYDAAQNQRRIGNYRGAIAAFQNFIAQHPNSQLAHRAQYWIGDSYYNLRDFKSAIANQQRLLATYPESTSVPDALLNIASSQLELGDTPGAKKTMDRLVARYPTSDAAEKAKRRLATLK
jgi:tol-pal system protein YbgF